MIEWLMFGALGFFLGCLLALVLASPLWNRAVKLTTRKLEATMPMSLADIQADKDQLRAEFAIAIRKVEVALDKAKEKAARELIEANKRRVEIQVLNTELAAAKGQIQERDNANRVLQQTIKRRLPDLDSRLKAAKKALAELESINTELRNTVASQSEALKVARATLHNQRADIDRLRAALEAGGTASLRGSSKADARYLAESQRLSAELSRAQEELKRAQTTEQENAWLRREMTKLAAQVLSATRNQEAPPRMAGEITQAFADFERREPRDFEAASRGTYGGNGEGRETLGETAMETETAGAETYGDVPADDIEDAAASDEAHAADHGEGESEAVETPKGPLAKRFAARRKGRRGGKGKSLGDRLRGVAAES